MPASDADVLVQMFLDDEVVFESGVPGTIGTIQQIMHATAGDHRLRIYAGDVLYRDEVITFREQG